MTKQIFLLTTLALATVTAVAQKRVLFVMSGANELKLKNDKTYSTGVFLSEFYLAYKDITLLGYEVDFATPNGIKPSIDSESLNKKYWGKRSDLIAEAENFVRDNENFSMPNTLEEALENIDRYSGMIVPGGQGLMTDLIHDKIIPQLLIGFANRNKAIGLICHAPALILTIPKDTNPFTGYRVNSVTALEEFFIETFVMKGKPTNRKIAKQLKKSGLIHKKGRPAGNFAIRDRELITSQNPYSNQAFMKLYLEALNEQEILLKSGSD